jgi:hypothetical protein
MDGQGTNFTVVIEKDCSEYDGCITLVPSKEVAFGTWDTSLLLGNTVIAGIVRLTGGTAIEAKSGVGTVGSLLLEPNSVIEVSGSTQASGYVNVRDSFEANGPVAVKLNFDPRQDDSDTASVTVLTVPMAARLDIADFILDTGSVEVGAQYCGLAIVEDEATVQKSLVVRFNKAVKQLSHYDDENDINKYDSNSSFTNENAWSDYTTPHSNVHYYSKDHYLRTKPQSRTTGYEFPGLSFTADGGQLILDSKSFKVPEYHTRGKHQIWLGAKYFNEERRIVTDRFVASSGIVTLAACKGQTLTVEGRISGNALLYLRGASNQSRPQGNYRLKGVHTGFIGNIYVEQQDSNCDFESYYQTLYVEDGRNLGGRKPEFDESALKLAANSRISVTNSNVLLEEGLNRGLSIKDSGRLYVDKN